MEFCQANYDCNMGVSNVKFADNLLFESTFCSLQIIPAKFTRDVHVIILLVFISYGICLSPVLSIAGWVGSELRFVSA